MWFYHMQLDFFRKGCKALEAVDPVIRIVAEKNHIDYQLSELDTDNSGVFEDMNGYEIIDDGELSFDYRQKKQGLDNVATSSYQMEVSCLQHESDMSIIALKLMMIKCASDNGKVL